MAFLLPLAITAWRFLTHPRMHLDEHVSYELFRDVGKHLFPGIEKNPIVFNTNGSLFYNGKNAEQLGQEGFLIVGAMNSSLDEHAREGKVSVKGQSASSLSLAFLEEYIDEDALAPWRPIIEATRIDDLGGHDSSDPSQKRRKKPLMGMGMLLKALHRCNHKPETVCEWVRTALRAVCDANKRRAKGEKQELQDSLLCPSKGTEPADKALEIWLNWKFRKEFQDIDNSRDLVTLFTTGRLGKLNFHRMGREKSLLCTRGANLSWSLLIRDRKLNGEKAISNIVTFLLKEEEDLLHVRSIVRDMIWCGRKTHEILDWAFMAFDARLRENVAFSRALVELASPSVGRQTIGSGDNQIRILMVNSDSEAIGGATGVSEGKDNRPDVTIQIKSDNRARFAIDKGSRHAEALRARFMPILAGKVRRLDCEARGIDIPEGMDLNFEGSSEQMPWWFYHEGLAMLLNGSESAPDVEPTALCPEEIFQCLCEAWEEACAIAA